jgi:hypothetical protein
VPVPARSNRSLMHREFLQESQRHFGLRDLSCTTGTRRYRSIWMRQAPSRTDQNCTFSANWSSRELYPGAVAETAPKVGSPTVLSGAANTTSFSKLKASARNWMVDSRTSGKLLNTEKSRSLNASERNAFLPNVPKLKAGGVAKAFGLSHWAAVRFVGVGLPTRSAWTKVLPVFAMSPFTVTL